MAILTNQKPTIYRNLYENTAPEHFAHLGLSEANSLLKFSRYFKPETGTTLIATKMLDVGSLSLHQMP